MTLEWRSAATAHRKFYERKVERISLMISGKSRTRAILKSQIGELEKRLAATEVAIADLERAKDFACSRIVESHSKSWPSQTEGGRSNVG